MNSIRSLGLNAAIIAIFVAAASLIAVGSASATHVECGDVITQDTTLDSDLTCAGDGLTVTGNGVTVNLAGHAIQGDHGGTTGIFAQADDTEVTGGTIRRFSSGVRVDGGAGLVVREMLLEQDGAAVECTFSRDCSVLDSTMRSNVVGVVMEGVGDFPSHRGLVDGSALYDNRFGVSISLSSAAVTDNRTERNGTGVDINEASVVVTRNLVGGNNGDGIEVSFLANATISSNQIERNGGNGVHVIGDFFFENTAATVRDNRIARNAGDGVLVENIQGAHPVVIERNRADRNGDDGIDLQFAPNEPSDPNAVDALVRANKAYFNGDLGIHAVPGTIDGGGNKAQHNGNPAQCVGVRCK